MFQLRAACSLARDCECENDRAASAHLSAAHGTMRRSPRSHPPQGGLAAGRRYRLPGDRAEPSRRPLACPPGQRRPAAVRPSQADPARSRLDARRSRSGRLLRRARGYARLPPPTCPRRARAAVRRNLARAGPPVGTRVLPLQARRSKKTLPLGSMYLGVPDDKVVGKLGSIAGLRV